MNKRDSALKQERQSLSTRETISFKKRDSPLNKDLVKKFSLEASSKALSNIINIKKYKLP